MSLAAPVVGEQGGVGTIDSADFADGETAVITDGHGQFIVDKPQRGVGIHAVALHVIGNPAAHVDGFAPLVGHYHAHRVDAHVAGVLINVIPVRQVHAATLSQPHEVDHAVLVKGGQPAGAGVAVAGLSQQQGNALVGIVLQTPHAHDGGVGVHMHHLVQSDGLACGQVKDAVRQLLAVVVVAEVVAVKGQRVVADACITQEVVTVVDLVAVLPLAGARHNGQCHHQHCNCSHHFYSFFLMAAAGQRHRLICLIS